MRVLHVLDHSLPLHSGYAFRTASILREQAALGWTTAQLTTPRQNAGNQLEEVVGDLRFHRTPFSPGRPSWVPGGNYLQEMSATARRLGELVRQFEPDILHAHSPVLNALPALWVGRKQRIPVVYELRALWEDAAVDHGTTREGSVRYRASRALETFALRHADHVTTICEGLRDEIVARRIPQERVTVIPNAVDVEAFRAGDGPDATLRTELGLDEAVVIGFAGSFYAYEGLDLLLAAVRPLIERHANLRVLLVGGGPQESSLKTLADKLGIAGRVKFTGRVPQNEVQRYYDLMDVLAYPRHSIRLTNLVTPLKPLEAMAQGRMFVASDVGGHRELVRDGQTGFLFRAGDADALARAIDSLLLRRDDWPRVREQARKFVETERTWARSVARYAAVYESLLHSRPRVAARLKHHGP